MTVKAVYQSICDLLESYEQSALRIRFQIGLLIVELLKNTDSNHIANACADIAYQIEKKSNRHYEWRWYYMCYLYATRLTGRQRAQLLTCPHVTIQWLNNLVRKPEAERSAVLCRFRDLKARDFATRSITNRCLQKREYEREQERNTIEILLPLDMTQIENALASLYAEAKRSFEMDPRDIDKAVEEARRRAGV